VDTLFVPGMAIIFARILIIDAGEYMGNSGKLLIGEISSVIGTKLFIFSLLGTVKRNPPLSSPFW